MSYCSYYQAQIERSLCWFLTATLRSHEHVAFDRTVDVATSTFEFFVPESMESRFLHIMKRLEHQGIVRNLQKMPNRLLDPNETI